MKNHDCEVEVLGGLVLDIDFVSYPPEPDVGQECRQLGDWRVTHIGGLKVKELGHQLAQLIGQQHGGGFLRGECEKHLLEYED